MMFLGFIMMTNIITALGTFSVAKLCHVIRLMFKTNAASFLDGFSLSLSLYIYIERRKNKREIYQEQ